MKETVSVAQAATARQELPPRVEEALGELVGAAKDGLLALSVGVGLGVLTELMEEEVDEVVGAKGKHDRDQSAVRHGHDPGEVTLGGRRVAVERPRARTADGESEVALATYAHFADRDPLTRVVLSSVAVRKSLSEGKLHGAAIPLTLRLDRFCACGTCHATHRRRWLGLNAATSMTLGSSPRETKRAAERIPRRFGAEQGKWWSHDEPLPRLELPMGARTFTN